MAAAWSPTYGLRDGKNWDFDGCPGDRSLGDLGRARGQEAFECGGKGEEVEIWLKIHDLDVDDAHLARHCGLVTPAYAFHNTSFVRLELLEEDVCRRRSCRLLQRNPAALSLP